MYRRLKKQQQLGEVRLTDEEVQGVIALWVERQGFPQQSSVADVAEGLDVSIEDVHQLLKQLRARRAVVEAGIAQERERLGQEQRLMAEEQARLALAESCLLEYHISRSSLHERRLEIHTRWVPKPAPVRGYAAAHRARPASPPPVNRSFSLADHTMMVAVSGIVLTILWSLLSTAF